MFVTNRLINKEVDIFITIQQDEWSLWDNSGWPDVIPM